MGKASTADLISNTIGFVILGAAIWISALPGARPRVAIENWLERRQVRSYISKEWPVISNGATLRSLNNATGVVVEFIDYQCVYCRAFADSTVDFGSDSSGLDIVIKHLPRPGDLLSRAAALAAICAQRQGRFSQLHELLLTDTTWTQTRDWERLGQSAGIPDLPSFARCQSSETAIAMLDADTAVASALKVRATPTFVTQSRGVHAGVVSLDTLKAWALPAAKM